MAERKLRGATRRDFIKGTFAIGAALGWGPNKVLEVLDRGGGLAHGATGSKSQNLLIINGSTGAHGYWQSVFPAADAFAGDRYGMTTSASMMPLHFLQDAAGGGTATNFGGALQNINNYASLPNAPDNGLGAWSAGERFKRRSGADNMAFRGFTSTNAASQAIDNGFFKKTTVPTTIDPAQSFILYARETPFAKYGMKKAVTQIDGGPISVHATGAQNHYISRAKNWSVMSAAAMVQQSTRPAVVQAIMCGEMTRVGGTGTADFYGALPGAPQAAVVGSANEMVNLFASNAVRAGGALFNQKNASLYEAFYKGLVGSSKSATLPTYFRSYQTTKLSSNLVGLDLASKLAPTDADRLRYGLTGNNPPKFAELRDRLIVAERAFKLGLSTTICVSFGYDDPHGLFTAAGVGGTNAATSAAILGNFLNAFMEALMQVPDPFHPELKLGDNTVIAMVGDNLRSTVNKSAWPDPSLRNQNRTWVMHNGFLRTGSFGGERPVGPNLTTAEGGLYDLTTGQMIPSTMVTAAMINDYGETAMAAVLYAVTRGDDRRVLDFYSGLDFPVLRVPILL